MLFANRDSLNATIYFLEATTTIVIAKKSLNLDEVLELLYQYYKTHIAIFFRVSPMYFVAYVFPRDKNLWVFGSYENSFDGNAKYLFIYINQSMPHIRAVWITKDKQIKRLINQLGFCAQLKHSFIGYYYSLRASVYFYNNTYSNIDQWNSVSALRFNLWHGIPLKKIKYDEHQNTKLPIYDINDKRAFNIDLYKRHDYVLSTSDFVSDLMSSAFKLSQERCVSFGYPRVELFSKPKEEVLAFVKKYEPQGTKDLIGKLNEYSKVFVYMPTWRDDGSNFIEKSGIDFKQLDQTLKMNNYVLLLKLHHHTAIDINTAEISNIILLDNNFDTYPILPFTDYLITDYSSIYFEYLLLNKEILFFCFDLDDYLKRNRRMYFDYESITPGKKIYSFRQLIELLMDKEALNSLNHSQERQELSNKLWSKGTTLPSKEIAEFTNLLLKTQLF